MTCQACHAAAKNVYKTPQGYICPACYRGQVATVATPRPRVTVAPVSVAAAGQLYACARVLGDPVCCPVTDIEGEIFLLWCKHANGQLSHAGVKPKAPKGAYHVPELGKGAVAWGRKVMEGTYSLNVPRWMEGLRKENVLAGIASLVMALEPADSVEALAA